MRPKDTSTKRFILPSSLPPAEQIRAVFFDLDGTLYKQKPLQMQMLIRLLLYYMIRPHKIKQLNWLRIFRKHREGMAGRQEQALEQKQYAEPAVQLGISPQTLQNLVEQWIHKAPLRLLKKHRYQGAKELIDALKENGIYTAVYSDYPVEDKLRVLNIDTDKAIHSTQKEINSFKPQAKGLLYLCDYFGLKPSQCLYVGDRVDRDGEAARKAKIHYFIISKRKNPYQPLLQYFSK